MTENSRIDTDVDTNEISSEKIQSDAAERVQLAETFNSVKMADESGNF